MKTSFEKFMASNAVNPVKIELATIDQNVTKLQGDIAKSFDILDKGTQDIRKFLALAQNIKIDQGVVKELEKQREMLKSLGVPPNTKIDYAIENAEIIGDIVSQVQKSLSSYLNSIKAYDI
jgi:hypothetical protein